MTTLQDRQSKIQDKRKQTPWREFIREVASLFPLNFYKNNNLISVYPPSPRVTVISPKEYSHRGSNNMNSSIGDHEGSFFEKLSHLVQNNPTPSVIHFRENDNVDYANCVFGAKNVYLSFAIGEETENCFYSAIVYKKCSNIFSSVAVTNYCENIYNAKAISKSSFIFYSKYIHNSSNIRFSTNLIGCHNCFRCDALENMSYCIDNTPYSKDEYYKKVHILLQDKNNFEHYFKQLRNEAINYASTKVSGNRILESHNISSGYIVSKLNHGRNNLFVEGVDGCEDFYDVFEVGVNAKHFYAVCNGGSSEHVYCSNLVENSQNIYYSFYIDTCSFCLGCIGLKNKSYCIFNKQYTKDEREQKVNEIFGQMEKDETLGEFFPASMCPYYFNDTAAYLIDNSFTKEEVTAKGYLWRDEAVKVDIPTDAEIVLSTILDQFESFDTEGNRIISADILKKVIQDESGNYYRIIPMEYKFLMKHGLPLPRQHWLERMKQNFKIN